MKTVTLAGGRVFKVYVKHTTTNERRARRMTFAAICEGDMILFTEKAVCSRKDTFEKRVGRKLVAERVLDSMRTTDGAYTKLDRQKIFRAICPEYHKKAERSQTQNALPVASTGA